MNPLKTSQHRRLRWLIADLKLELALLRLARKYRPDQPRDDRGRWVDEGATDISAARRTLPIVREFGKMTVREFVSRYCEAKVNRELPGQFENMTITDIWNIARGGDARAKTCLKLLNSGRFRT
jgi:hypothetical protein